MEYEARREVGRDERDGERRQTTDDRWQTTDDRRQTTDDRGQRAEDFLSVVSGPLSVAKKHGVAG
jgi:hypothetical protein